MIAAPTSARDSAARRSPDTLSACSYHRSPSPARPRITQKNRSCQAMSTPRRPARVRSARSWRSGSCPGRRARDRATRSATVRSAAARRSRPGRHSSRQAPRAPRRAHPNAVELGRRIGLHGFEHLIERTGRQRGVGPVQQALVDQSGRCREGVLTSEQVMPAAAEDRRRRFDRKPAGQRPKRRNACCSWSSSS